MAKRSKSNGIGSERVKPVVEESQPNITIVYIRALYPSIIKYAGQETGQLYTWSGAGDVQPVDSRDAPYLLAKRRTNRACCGGAVQEGGYKMFEQEIA